MLDREQKILLIFYRPIFSVIIIIVYIYLQNRVAFQKFREVQRAVLLIYLDNI